MAVKFSTNYAADSSKSSAVSLPYDHDRRSAAASKGWETRRANAALARYTDSVAKFEAYLERTIEQHAVWQQKRGLRATYPLANGYVAGNTVTPKPLTLRERFARAILKMMGVKLS